MRISESLARPPLIEGKTKRIYKLIDDPDMVIVISKDDLTAGDGAKHDVLEGKAVFANETTCCVFEFLKSRGVHVAFKQQLSSQSFLALNCTMLPYEVVIRGEAHDSYLKRNPGTKKGYVLKDLVPETYLKTSRRKWKNHDLICDDPYMLFISGRIYLFDPKIPNTKMSQARPFLSLDAEEVFTFPNEASYLSQMEEQAKEVFILLREEWKKYGGNLVDFKLEFGIDPAGKLILADVIDNDSWRVLDANGEHLDKQHYRNGGTLEEVLAKYRIVAKIVARFGS